MNPKSAFFQKLISLLSSLVILSVVSAAAEVKLPALFSDNMVLQRDAWVPVWGWAAPGEGVAVELNGQKVSAEAGRDGRWEVLLEPMTAGAGPFELKVTGVNKIVIRNIAIGEVWLCSGQSNMAMEVRRCLDADKETAAARFPLIRQFQIKRGKALEPVEDVLPTGDEKSWLNKWRPCSPATVINFSGAGYFFARELYRKLGVPVGLIHSSWGGTTAEAWTRRGALESDPQLRPILDSWPGYNYDEDWLKGEYEKFVALVDSARSLGRPEPLYFNQPSVLYNAMIAPLTSFAIRGAVWYQGESNARRAYQYRRLFQAMIENWRADWGRGDFPFLFMQLVNFEEGSGTWPYLREAQSMALSLPNTAMAVGIDIGEPDDIHPKNKQEVGRRLALAARALVYGEEIVYSGPLYKSMRVEHGRCRIAFDHAGDGLAAAGGGSLTGFLIAGADQKFVEARAVIEGGEVVVSSGGIKTPVAVRYAWSDNPVGCNLWNMVEGKAWLPASPFRTDDW